MNLVCDGIVSGWVHGGLTGLKKLNSYGNVVKYFRVQVQMGVNMCRWMLCLGLYTRVESQHLAGFEPKFKHKKNFTNLRGPMVLTVRF